MDFQIDHQTKYYDSFFSPEHKKPFFLTKNLDFFLDCFFRRVNPLWRIFYYVLSVDSTLETWIWMSTQAKYLYLPNLWGIARSRHHSCPNSPGFWQHFPWLKIHTKKVKFIWKVKRRRSRWDTKIRLFRALVKLDALATDGNSHKWRNSKHKVNWNL